MSTTAIAYLLVFGAMLLATLFANPRYGLYAYVATFYLHPVDRWWGGDLPEWRWSLIAAAVTLIATIRVPARTDRPGWTANAAAKLLITLTLWIWIQNLWALSPESHLDLSILYTKYLVLIYLIYRLVDDEVSIRGFLMAHVLGCFYLGVLVLQAPDAGRLEGVGGPGIDESNSLAMQMGTGLMAAAALLAKGSLLQRAFALAALAVIGNGIVQTESRGAFLGIAAGGLALFALSPARHRRQWILLGVVGLAVLFRLAPDNFWERMSTISTTARTETPVDQSSLTRLALFKAQWEMFLAYPMGSGHRGTAALSPRYLSDENLTQSRTDPYGQRLRSSHNTFMTALSEQGLPGAIIFTWLLAWIARTSLAARARFQETDQESLALYLMATASSLAVAIVAGMFTDYFKAEIFIWAIALLAGLYALPQSSALAATSSPATDSIARQARGETTPLRTSSDGTSARIP